FVSHADGIVNRIAATGWAFWEPSINNDFGHYGYLGNHFGETRFYVEGIKYEVAKESAENFKVAQLKLAVRATLRGLMWELGPALMQDKWNRKPVRMAAQED